MLTKTEWRFWQKVDIQGDNHCWNWLNGKSDSGYGVFFFNGRLDNAHRVAWILVNGPIKDRLSVLHNCDNAICCNPDHLFLGTQQDNMIDMVTKGRGVNNKGENHGLSKLKTEDVLDIKRSYRLGHTQIYLATKYNITQPIVSRIINNKNWRHIQC